jgi:hypothetical protein
MRVEAWNPNAMDETFENLSVDKLVECAEVVKREAVRLCPVGTVSRPIYLRGPYSGKTWTARDKGQLKKSIRVVQKKNKNGTVMLRKRDVRVYAGNYLAYYASIVEFRSKAFMRSALMSANGEMMSIIRGK